MTIQPGAGPTATLKIKKHHRLFWKIVAVFWLTIILTAVTNIAITRQISDIENKTENIKRQTESLANDAVTIYETSGKKALNHWYKRIYKRHQIRAVLLDEQNHRIGKPVKPLRSRDEKYNGDDRPHYLSPERHSKTILRRLPRVATLVSITSPDGQSYSFRLLPSPYLHKELGSPGDYRWLRILTTLTFILIASLWLSRYVIKPVLAINTASQKMASGKLSTRVKPEIGERKDELGALGASFDQMASQLEKTITEQKQILRDISHEIRTPLTRQRIAIDLIREQINQSDHNTDDLLNKIENQNNKLNELTGNLLTLNRLDEKQAHQFDEQININSLLQTLLDDAEIEASTKNIQLQLRETGTGIIKGNALLLERAFGNIIGNAVKYTANNTTVTVNVFPGSAETSIEIVDQGPGLTADEQLNVFTAFYRADSSRTQKTGGYGLGLAIVKKVIELHHGVVALHSPKEGGLNVTVKLPNSNI